MFDPHAYGEEIAGILALDGNGERLMPLAGGTCSSEEARSLVKASRLPPVELAGLYLYFSCWDDAHRVAQDIETPEGSYWHAIVHRQEPDPGNAAYWFRHLGRHPIFPALRRAGRGNRDRVREELGSPGLRLLLRRGKKAPRARRSNKWRWPSSGRSGSYCSIGAPKPRAE